MRWRCVVLRCSAECRCRVSWSAGLENRKRKFVTREDQSRTVSGVLSFVMRCGPLRRKVFSAGTKVVDIKTSEVLKHRRWTVKESNTPP
jgi:hypothetical protein